MCHLSLDLVSRLIWDIHPCITILEDPHKLTSDNPIGHEILQHTGIGAEGILVIEVE